MYKYLAIFINITTINCLETNLERFGTWYCPLSANDGCAFRGHHNVSFVRRHMFECHSKLIADPIHSFKLEDNVRTSKRTSTSPFSMYPQDPLYTTV